MFFFIDEACSRPPLRLLTNVNKKMFFFIEGFTYHHHSLVDVEGHLRAPIPNNKSAVAGF